MRFLAGLFLLFSSLAPAHGEDKKVGEKPRDLKEAVRIVETSDDATALTDASLQICRSKDLPSIRVLAKSINSPRFYPLFAYTQDNVDANWPGARILQAIGELSSPDAEAILLQLASDQRFAEDSHRKCAVCKAIGSLKDPSPKLWEAVDELANPETGCPEMMIYALAKIGKKEAARRIGDKLLSDKYTESSKQDWLTNSVFQFRISEANVKMYKRLLHAKIKDDDLRDAAVQSVFDYRPTKWFGNDYRAAYPKPPSWKDASTETLKELAILADHCLTLDIPKDTKEAVEKSKKEIVAILAERKSEKK